jgi:acyl homoserine lactone synthase
MLKLIPGNRASSHPREMDAMFRSRARTFSDRLGWEVKVQDDYERDRFDDENPLYLISVNPETGEYWGSLRLLPTTGPNMLRDVFPQLLEEAEIIESATIWESSRIHVANAKVPLPRRNGRVSYVLAELILGIAEVSLIAGLTQIVTVTDWRFLRILKMAGWDPQIIGRPQRIGDTMTCAVVFDQGEGTLAAARAALGVTEPVLSPHNRELVFP